MISGDHPPVAADRAAPVSEGARRTVEFRIHGIGNHSAWSTLGNPRLTSAESSGSDSYDDGASYGTAASQEPRRLPPDKFVLSYSPPPNVDRNVWLLNWARTSRKTARLAWFLAIPITMVNVAGHMHPPRGEGWRCRLQRAVLTAAVHVSAATLTVSIFIWSVVIAETVLKHTGGWNGYVLMARLTLSEGLVALAAVVAIRFRLARWPIGTLVAGALAYLWFSGGAGQAIDASGLEWEAANWTPVYQWTAFLIGVGFAVLIAARTLIRPQNAVSQSLAFAHALLFVAIGFWVALERPSRWKAPEWLPTWATVYHPGELCGAGSPDAAERYCAPQVDVVTLAIVATTSLTLVLGLLTVACGYLQPTRPNRRPNMAGAGLLILLAPIVLNAMGSLLRVSVDWLLLYVDRTVSYVDSLPDHPNPFPFRTLTPYANETSSVYRIDLMILCALLIGLCLGLAASAVWLVKGRMVSVDPPAQAPPDTQVAVAHRAVQGLPACLGATVLVATPLFVLGVIWLDENLGESSQLPGPARLAIALTVQGTALLLALLFSGRLPKARDVLERFADVAAFWRARYHPLAGASYRPQVLRGIVHEIERSGADRIVLVGHSQGSILAACVVGGHFEADQACRTEKCLVGKSWRLVTCGSPMASLYGAFFPEHIDSTFLQQINRETSENWTNCWRTTDALSSEIPTARNEWLPDPLPGESRPRGHSDYWTDPSQVARISEYKQSSSS